METRPASRATRQREAIARAMDELGVFVSAQDLHELLRRRGDSVGLTTVYRNLQAMAERDEVDVVRREDGESLYRKCVGDGHHHHLVCRSCGFSVEISNDDVERWTNRAAKRHGFSDVSHDLEVFGVCESCTP